MRGPSSSETERLHNVLYKVYTRLVQSSLPPDCIRVAKVREGNHSLAALRCRVPVCEDAGLTARI